MKKENCIHAVMIIAAIIIMVLGTLYNLDSYNEQDIIFMYEGEDLCVNKGEQYVIQLLIENCRMNRVSSGDMYFLSYHILNLDGTYVEYDGVRTPIELQAKSKQKVDMLISAPWTEGDYILQIDIVQEGISWISTNGNKCLNIPLHVTN